MRFIAFLLIAVTVQQELPYKPSEEFDVTLDYQFKPYKRADKEVVYSTQGTTTGSLLYLIANVKIKKLSSDEARVSLTSNLDSSLINKKAVQDMVLKIDFGFIEDVKGRLTAHEYNAVFISPDKKEISRIHLFISEDGTFLVNGQKRGKF